MTVIQPNREKDRAGKGLPDRQIIFRRQQIQDERESDQRDQCQGEVQVSDPDLKRHLELKIDLSNAGEGLAKHHCVETNQDDNAKPKQQQKRNNILRPPIAWLGYAISVTERLGDCRDKNGSAVNAE